MHANEIGQEEVNSLLRGLDTKAHKQGGVGGEETHMPRESGGAWVGTATT